MTENPTLADRRAFLKAGTIAAAASALPSVLNAQVAGSAEIKIALVGCGGRGSGAAAQSLNVPGTKLVAMADAFADNVEGAFKNLKGQFGDRVDVPQERRFSGFDAYKNAIDSADVVLLCTPPGFRPTHFEYAVKQGKHVFMEKPVAVDGPGIRKVIEAAKVADQKKLKVVCGLQRRYQASYLETLKMIEDGAIGDFVSSQVYWVSGGVWVRDRKPEMSEMQYQMRNWYYFNWICGDHITEQHVHNLDVGNWFKGANPVKAVGMGGRSQRVGKNYGEIFDHFYVEYTYADGTVMNSQSRHWNGVWSRVSETVAGTAGSAYPGMIKDRAGKVVWRFRDKDNNPYQTEHDRLYDFIRTDTPNNDAVRTAEATLTSILGRMACYSGAEVTWDQAMNSELDTLPKTLAWDGDPGPKPGPDGMYPSPVPGAGKYF
ncbi:MAG: dehydrogenase [Verrucomicrobiia bacterium Tous-C4TDCM]|jgi:predicted dehydrogenase|nr:MAG: dehydrogenase [Verrucomicrobiae bacterium Tous-C4TDCM]